MSSENNENMGKMLANFIQKTNLIYKFELFTKRSHTILFGISVFTACYTTFSFFMYKNMEKLNETVRILKYLITYDISDKREKNKDIFRKIESMLDKIEEHDGKLDEYKKSMVDYTYFIEQKILVQNTPIDNLPIDNPPIQKSRIDASTQTEPFTINQNDELDNECYDIIPCSNIKKYHFI